MIRRIDITSRLQSRMLEIVRTALPLITKTREDADLDGLAHLRGEMVEAIAAYWRHVHALQATGQLSGSQARRLMTGCTSLHAAYEAFRSRWDHRDGMDHWHEYRLSAVVMMKQVRTLVEEAESLASQAAFRRNDSASSSSV